MVSIQGQFPFTNGTIAFKSASTIALTCLKQCFEIVATMARMTQRRSYKFAAAFLVGVEGSLNGQIEVAGCRGC